MTEHTGEPIPVLDHGFVRLIDYYGGDVAIESSARQSYGKGTRRVNTTRGLLRRLVRDRHDSPLESCHITIQFKTPIFVARQILRHRLLSVNEVSGRFSELPEEYYIPSLEQICYQDKKNKQGRAESLAIGRAQAVQGWMRVASAGAFDHYHRMLAEGVARETARMILPLNTYTVFSLAGNLRTWLHFLHLRMDKHAQWETREFANEVAKIVATIAPEAYDAWEEYVKEATWLSRTTRKILKRYVDVTQLSTDEMLHSLSEREREDFLAIFAADEDAT